MKKKDLTEISNEKYYVKDNCTFKHGKGKICNFYISEVTLFEKHDKKVSFEITLTSKQDEEKITETNSFPISYLYDPLSWSYDFDIETFQITTTKKEFEQSMIEIIKLILRHNKYDVMEEYVGWGKKILNNNTLFEDSLYYFRKFDPPCLDISLDQSKPSNYLYEYMQLTDFSVSAPLFSYMLLSLLTSLRFLGPDTKACFNVALVGGLKEVRRIYALFFTNLYRRDPYFYNYEYKFFHINEKDSLTDIRYKARFAKDCVIIAFEPDKRHLNPLLTDLYRSNTIDKDRPIENLLLYTGKQHEKSAAGNTLVITLNNEHSTKSIQEYFNTESYDYKDDCLMDCIYYFIQELTKRILNDKNYIRKEFLQYRDSFLKEKSTVLSETAQEVASLLLFAFKLYNDVFDNTDKQIYLKGYLNILKAVENSFPLDGQVTEESFEKGKNICRYIDRYFEPKKNKNLVGRIGFVENVPDIRIWYNENYIYITLQCIREFLKLTNSNLTYCSKAKIALAENDIIKTYSKNGKISDYSVRLQEKLNKTETTKKRYVAFNRDVCRKYNLFPNLEEIFEI